jgi:hypothetical protein
MVTTFRHFPDMTTASGGHDVSRKVDGSHPLKLGYACCVFRIDVLFMLKKNDWSFLKGKKSEKSEKTVKLPPPEKLSKDYGLHSLENGHRDSMTFHVEYYSIANDLPGQWHMQFAVEDDFITSVLADNKQGEYIKRNNPHCFKVKLSPSEEFKDRWGNRVVPFRVVEILD